MQIQIQEQLPTNSPLRVHVEVSVQKSDLQKGIKYKQCSIYIKFMENKNQIGHITIHFYKQFMKRSNNIGRIHARNNRRNFKHAYTFRTNTNNSISMELISFPNQIHPSLQTPFAIVTQILNQYIHPESDLFLGKNLTSMTDSVHDCVSYTERVLRQSRTPLSSTRKSNAKYKSNKSGPLQYTKLSMI